MGDDRSIIPVTDDLADILSLIGIPREETGDLKKYDGTLKDRDRVFTILSSSPLFDVKYIRWSTFKHPPTIPIQLQFENWVNYRYDYPTHQGVSAPDDMVKTLHEVIYTRYPVCRDLRERLLYQMEVWKKLSSHVETTHRVDNTIQSLWNVFIQLHGLLTLSKLSKEEVNTRWTDFLQDHERYVWVGKDEMTLSKHRLSRGCSPMPTGRSCRLCNSALVCIGEVVVSDGIPSRSLSIGIEPMTSRLTAVRSNQLS